MANVRERWHHAICNTCLEERQPEPAPQEPPDGPPGKPPDKPPDEGPGAIHVVVERCCFCGLAETAAGHYVHADPAVTLCGGRHKIIGGAT